MKTDRELWAILQETGRDPRRYDKLSKEERNRLFFLIIDPSLRVNILEDEQQTIL